MTGTLAVLTVSLPVDWQYIWKVIIHIIPVVSSQEGYAVSPCPKFYI
jgi:hypothetical protein